MKARDSFKAWEPPEDSVRLLLDFAAYSLLELLSLALIDKQFHAVASKRFARELHWFGINVSSDGDTGHRPADMARVLMPQVAQKFVQLPKLMLCSPCVTDQVVVEPCYDEFAPFNEDEAVFCCQHCEMPIVKFNDIISSDYQIMKGRGYFTAMAYNVNLSDDSHAVGYTSGRYTVRHVSCGRCSLQLGITYATCDEEENEYKLGKFLLAQYLLLRPPCCLSRTQPLTFKQPTTLCRRCERTATRSVLELVNCITQGLFSLSRMRRLYELLLRQHALELLAEHRAAPPSISSDGRILTTECRALVAWCLPLLRPRAAGIAQVADAQHIVTRLASTSRPVSNPESSSPIAAGLHVHIWQDALKDRLGMLTCLRPAIQDQKHLYTMLTSVVRFIGAFCCVAQHSAPLGTGGVDRGPALLKLLPALVVPSRNDACRSAKALSLAVRKEWAVTTGEGDTDVASGCRALTAMELNAIDNAIESWAAEEHTMSTSVTTSAAASSRGKVAPTPGSTRGGSAASRVIPPVPPWFWHGDNARQRHSPRSRSPSQSAIPLQAPLSAASVAEPPHFAPPPRHQTRVALANSPATFPEPVVEGHRLRGSEEAASHINLDVAHRGYIGGRSVAVVDSADDDSVLLCCLTCGAPTVKVGDAVSANYRMSPSYHASFVHGSTSPEDPHEPFHANSTTRDLCCLSCACRNEPPTNAEQERSFPPPPLAGFIIRYLVPAGFMVPATAQPAPATARSWSSASRASSSRALVPQTQTVLQVPAAPLHGDASGRGRSTYVITATPRHLPLQVLLPASRE